jgi:transcription antitermination factor NusA-like protein
MTNTIEMEDLMHLKLFESVTKISTRHTFIYNNTLFFCVPKKDLSKAIGKEAANVKKINFIAKKRVRILALPTEERDIKKFVESIVSPIEFSELEIKPNEVILTAGNQSKAALLGREKRRLKEMEKIVKDYFKKSFKII